MLMHNHSAHCPLCMHASTHNPSQRSDRAEGPNARWPVFSTPMCRRFVPRSDTQERRHSQPVACKRSQVVVFTIAACDRAGAAAVFAVHTQTHKQVKIDVPCRRVGESKEMVCGRFQSNPTLGRTTSVGAFQLRACVRMVAHAGSEDKKS